MSSTIANLYQLTRDAAREAMRLQTIGDVLQWDERTGMPVEAGEYRADQVAMIAAMVHRHRTAPEQGERLVSLVELLRDAPSNDPVAANVRRLHRDFQRDCRLPVDLVERMARVTVRGQQTWDAARSADDFGLFRDSLEEIVQIKRDVGERLAEATDQTVYEALLDEYEPDARETVLDATFAALRGPLVELIEAIADAPRQPSLEILRRDYPIEAQRQFSRFIAEAIGFDFDRGRLDETSHPFCTTLGPNDHRILTRYEPNWLPSGLFGTMHEAGHGMYEQGLPTDEFGLPAGTFASLGVHESQSRMWENQVGRSEAFWQWAFPTVRRHFPAALGDVSADQFHHAVNAVRPSLIRVEADEATYNLHIIIRFDLERGLISGDLSVDDLPEAWNDRYESDLGIRPVSAADGVLQDVHWGAGLIGYFPTYTLGNLIAAQLYRTAGEEIADLTEQLAAGHFAGMLGWLRDRVHRHGRILSGVELVRQATGEDISAKFLVEELRSKLLPMYGVT